MKQHWAETSDSLETEGFEEWLNKEKLSLQQWRPANNAYDKQRIAENADSIALYEDIESALHIINQQEQLLDLINHLATLLGT